MNRPVTQHKRAAYPAYKPSGIEWLGEIPEYWEVKRLKFVANTVMGQSPNSDDYTFEESDRPFLQGNAEFGAENPTAKYYCETATKTAPAGSLLVSVRAPVGALNMADRCYGIGRGLCAVIPDQGSLISRFAWHTLTVTRHELWCIATGSTYEAVSADEVADMTVPIPPLTEQQAIAAFLDRETARIDTLIEKKRRQIELLQEKRSALISHAVTKGLDPNAKMKDSGIEWLGEIPEYWAIRRLKYVASINDEVLPETTDPDYEFVYVDIGSVDAAKGIVATETYRFEDAPSRARRIVRDGDTIVSTVRTYLRAIAPIRDADDNLIVSTGFAVVRPRKLDPGYLSYALRSPFFVETVVSRSTGVSYPAINAPEVGDIGVTLPPLDEQKAIAAFLDRETARNDALIEKVEKSIELLREYRTALISAAVTGKIDVRKEVV
ncbi:restriction endonuclease subunit S [Desulfoglaeba alkanexedens]|uniref:Restriction endonuclease subunit S n=1 Tax=Desulfoglaeba alkanexedens ALDC TaxID=980445 RepID=A0A4P8L4V9_9BACT|nr:restriction endonuclease subunit S [Desulfoglaeba alkanexedens]QCQ22085.1 restriction endonuclease subunit S [Desulfoglaeba alkanexedens ALDC]